ncbi:MAG: hypothetical protein ACT4OU_04930 [Hyphomicrobium sp.]
MRPLVFLAIAGAGAYATYKLLAKLVQQAQTPSPADVERRRRETMAARAGAATRNLGELELDEQTGVYRPRRAPKA